MTLNQIYTRFSNQTKSLQMKIKYVMASCLLTLFFSTMANGQKAFLSVGPELALPARYDQSHNNMGTGIGGSMRLESSWSKHVSGIITVGYLSFEEASPFSTEPTFTEQLNTIIIQAGIKYYIKEKIDLTKGVFFSSELGSMPTTKEITFTTGTKEKFKEGGLSLALGTGYQLKNLEASFRLQYNLTARGFHVYYYNFRLAYAFLREKKN
jgi:hypothetical protein